MQIMNVSAQEHLYSPYAITNKAGVVGKNLALSEIRMVFLTPEIDLGGIYF